MKDITERENELFDEWQDLSPKMVRDGAASAEDYTSSSPRVLIVMKEVNDPGGGGWDLRKIMREGGRPQTWTNITRWMMCLRALPEEVPWSAMSKITADDRRRELASLAMMNLKKEPGGHTSVGEEIANAATERAELLRKQFEIYEPDLVICGGTMGHARRVLIPEVETSRQTTTRGIDYLEYSPGRFMIDFSHPAARCANPLLVYGLVDAVREIWSDRLPR